MFVYGSFAMHHWFKDYPRPAPDIDVVVYDPAQRDEAFISTLRTHGIPVEIQDDISLTYFFEMFKDDIVDGYLTPNAILTVRMSHAMYAYNLDKTLSDIMFLQSKGCEYNLDQVHELRTHWKERYREFRPPLDMNQSAETFFHSNVTRFINHDQLHDRLKFQAVPAFTKIIKNNNTVAVSRDKFLSLTHEEQCHTFLEEIMVLACERHYYMATPKDAIVMSAGDFLARMTSGWYNIFVLDNLTEIFNFNDEHTLAEMSQIMTYLQQECSKYLKQGGVTHDMKLSNMRPDMAGASGVNDTAISDAIETTKEITGATPVMANGIQESPHRKLAKESESTGPRPMNSEETIAYSNMGVIKYLSDRIVELNEAMTTVQAEDNTVKEWEALTMIISELERARTNVPGYIEPSKSAADR